MSKATQSTQNNLFNRCLTMKDTDIVTKLTKMNVSRIALCKTPADQDGLFVLVKSEDGAPEFDKDEEGKDKEEKPKDGEKPKKDDEEPANDDVVKKESEENSEEVVSDAIAKAIADAVKSAIEKSPQMAYLGGNANQDGGAMQTLPPGEDDGGKQAVQKCIESLVKKCNESKTISKDIKMKVADIAKFHGVEGPSTDDDGSGAAFAEITAELKTVVDILKGLAVSMPKMSQPAAAPEAPAAKPAAKPAATKKSEDNPRIDSLEKSFEKVKFLLLQKMGRDPTPPSE